MPPAQLSHLDLTRNYTYADYLKWKFELVELVKGKMLRPLSGPGRRHQDYVANILAQLLPFLRGKQCRAYHAPFDVRLATSRTTDDEQIFSVVQPDVCVVCDPAKLDERGCLGAPDWVIEIISPGHTARDTKIKFDLYEECGVREYWIVFPGEKTVAAYQHENGRYRLSAEYAEPGPIPVRTLPGLTIDWSDVFTSP